MVDGEEARDAWTSTNCRIKDAKGKLKTYFLTRNFATRESISAQWRLQWCGFDLHGPFLRAVLLTTVKVNTRTMAAYPKKYTWTIQIALLLSFFEKREGMLR